MRPVAWAATIGLSLVVVLELTSLPGSDMAPSPQPVPVEAAPAPDVAEQRPDSIKEEALPVVAGEREDSLAKRSRPYSPEEQKAEKVAIMDDADFQETAEHAKRQVSQPAAMDVEEAPGAVAEESLDADSPHQAEPAAVGSAAARAESFASATVSLQAESDYLCPVEARLSAEKWLKCIEELEADLPPELVEREYEEFRKSYPDFELPAADK